VRFEADMPNECWQSDFTHYRLAARGGQEGDDTEILTFLDDHSRLVLHMSAHRHVTGDVVLAAFRDAVQRHGIPASTLTDNGFVFTARFAGGKGGRNAFETELHQLGIVQKNSRPNHPTTCGKVERLQQTLKKWLDVTRRPSTIAKLQVLLDEYNATRPHTSLRPIRTPETAYLARPKAAPGEPGDDRHSRVRHDIVDQAGKVTLRVQGQLHSIGIGRHHSRTHVILLVQDLDVRVVTLRPENSSGSCGSTFPSDTTGLASRQGLHRRIEPDQDELQVQRLSYVLRHHMGGDDGTRTHDPLLAKQITHVSVMSSVP
jgi:Integrase core domain